MSEHVTGHYRNQSVLFPSLLDDYVDKENPVRFIDAFIDSLNLEKLGFNHSVLAETGRPSYDPSDLLKALRLWLPKPGEIKQETGERMPPQPRSHVADEEAGSRLQNRS